MATHERQRTDEVDHLVLDDGAPVLDDAAVLDQLEGAAQEEAATADAAETGIPRVLDPAVGVFRGAVAGLFLWIVLLVAGFIAWKAL